MLYYRELKRMKKGQRSDITEGFPRGGKSKEPRSLSVNKALLNGSMEEVGR